MKPGDVIILGKKVWSIKGIHLGASGQQSVVALESLTQKHANAGDGTIKTLYVPIEFIEKMNEEETVIYTK